MNWILAHQTEIIAIIGGVVTIASIIVKLTPTPTDDKWFAKVYKVLEVLSLVKKQK
jgi:hypothetical protein